MDTETDDADSALRERLEQELDHTPAYILSEEGMRRVNKRQDKPSPVQVALMEEVSFLTTGLAWSAMADPGRIAIMVGLGSPASLGLVQDILEVLPEQSRLWLTGWQMQVNSGSCWHTSGSIGRTAAGLIEEGFLLCSAHPVTDWYGNHQPTREQIRPGAQGSPLFVRTIMGPRYLEWISAVE